MSNIKSHDNRSDSVTSTRNERITPKGFDAVTTLTENLAVFISSDFLQFVMLAGYFHFHR